MTTPVSNQTILDQLGKVNALVGKDLSVNAAGELTIKTHSAVKSFFGDLFTSKATKLARIQATAEALSNAVTADVRNRYSATGSQDNFNLQVALKNVNTAMTILKEQARELSSTQKSDAKVFGVNGALTPNGDTAVAAVLTRIDQVAGTSLAQINRLKQRPLSEKAIGMFTSNPKEQQIRQLRKDLDAVKHDLTVIPPTHRDHDLILREKAGLEYAISQLEMYIPTYAQDMKNLLEDISVPAADITHFSNLPDFDPAGPAAVVNVQAAGGKDSAIATLKIAHAANPAALAKIADLELMYQASLLVKAPIEYQAKKATARIATAHVGIARGSITRFGVDFERNVYAEYGKALFRGALTYMLINGTEGPMSLLGAASAKAQEFAPGYIGPVAGMALATLSYVAPVIAAKPDLVGKLVPQGVKNYFRGGRIEWLLS